MTTVRRTDVGKLACSDTVARTNPRAQKNRKNTKPIAAAAVTRVDITRVKDSKTTQRLQHTHWFWAPRWRPFLTLLFRGWTRFWHPLRRLSQSWRKPERALVGHLPHWQLKSRWRYGTSRASATSTAGWKNVNFTISGVPGSSSSQCRPASTAPLPAGFSRSTSSRIPGRHSDTVAPASTSSPRALSLPVTMFEGATPAMGTCTSSAALLSHGMGACASSASLLRYVIMQAIEARASGVAPRSLGTGPRSSSAVPPSHAPRSSQTAAPSRRSFQRRCPTLPPPGHAVAVGWRCGKAENETPRPRVWLDSSFSRKSGGSSTVFPVKEESTRLATSSPFPSRPTGRKTSPVGTLLPHTRARLSRRLQALSRFHPRHPTCATPLRMQRNRRNLTIPDEPV